MQQKIRKFTKFVPFDRILEGIEVEDVVDEDENTKIMRIFNRRDNHRMFQLEKKMNSEKEQLSFIGEIQKYEGINAEGVMCIERWSYNMQIDNQLHKFYKFLIIFEPYSSTLRAYIDQMKSKKSLMFKEDITRFFKTFIFTLHYMHQKQISSFNPICPESFVIGTDSQIRFNAIPILTTKGFQNRIKAEKDKYAAPETLKQISQKQQSSNIQQLQSNLNSIYQSSIFSFALLFLSLFLQKSIEELNQQPDLFTQYLKEVQNKFGDVYKNFLQGMLEFDPQKRIKIEELIYNLEHSEYFIVNVKQVGPNLVYSEIFDYYRKTFQVEPVKQRFRVIALAIPYQKSLLQANLFDKKKVFLEILDLKSEQTIPEGVSTLVADDGRIYLLGGTFWKHLFELNENEQILVVRAQLPHCEHDRSAFGCVLYKGGTEIVICSGLSDQEINKDPVSYSATFNLHTNTWTELPSVQKPAIGCTLIALNDEHIFKFGGVNGSGLPQNYIEKLEGQQWILINYQFDRHYPQFQMPSFAFATQSNPCQILVFGGQYKGQSHLHQQFQQFTNTSVIGSKIMAINMDIGSYNIETGEKMIFVEIAINDQFNYSEFGIVEQVQLSNNEIFLLQKKNDKFRSLTFYNHTEGFKEIRKIHI